MPARPLPVIMDIPATLAKLIRHRPRTLILSGAGISAESGIPTFRDAQTGLWARFSPTELASPEAFAANPARVLDWYDWRRELIAKAAPNAGHEAVATLMDALPECALVTQNVDGLHQLAGASQVVELHGNIWRLRCSRNCGFDTYWTQRNLAPPRRCESCNAFLRPGVVWFGEALPTQALQRALSLAESAELVIVTGTSGLVYPAAALPIHAMERGARVVEINPDATDLSRQAEWHLEAPSSLALPALAALLDAA